MIITQTNKQTLEHASYSKDTNQYILSNERRDQGFLTSSNLPWHFLGGDGVYLVLGETGDQEPHVDEEGEHVVAHVCWERETSRKHFILVNLQGDG